MRVRDEAAGAPCERVVHLLKEIKLVVTPIPLQKPPIIIPAQTPTIVTVWLKWKVLADNDAVKVKHSPMVKPR